MITESMNKVDINLAMCEAVQCWRKLLHVSAECKKLLKKHPKISYCKTETKRIGYQDYIALNFARLGQSGEQIMVKVMNNTHTWYYCYQPDIKDTMDAFSTHFFNRYAQRTGREANYPKIMCEFFMNNMHFVIIYKDEEKGESVYASREGISLCRTIKSLGITRFCTFVSNELLKETQREAYDIVQFKIREAEKKMSGDADMNTRIEQIRAWSDSCDYVTYEASKIYGLFFEED